MSTAIPVPDGHETRRSGHTTAYRELRNKALEAQKHSGTWVTFDGLTFCNARTARTTAYRIRSGQRAAFRDVGIFESSWKENEDGTYTVIIKHVES